jgi:hypothetical protein
MDLTYEDIVKLIGNGQKVYAIDEYNGIISGQCVGVVQTRETLSKDVSSLTPELKTSEHLAINMKMKNDYCHTNTIFLTIEDAKSELSIKIDGEIIRLSQSLLDANITSGLLK